MKKFKIDKNGSKRIIALIMAATFTIGAASGCTKNEKSTTTNVTTTSSIDQNDLVNSIKNEVIKQFPNISEETANNFALVLLLDSLAIKDENGKIDASLISKYKVSIDANNMMSDFNAVLDNLEFSMIENSNIIAISNLLPKGYEKEVLILKSIESITSNVISLSNSDANKEEILKEFDKTYSLFALEDEIELDGLKFEIRDLSYSNRAVAEAYARTIVYFARNYLTDEQVAAIDARTNNQNSKAYIKTTLEILDNAMSEQSETDTIALFNGKYSDFSSNLNGKVSVSSETVANLTNYINLEYLNSEKVSYNDKNSILVSYEDDNVSDSILAIDAINSYNSKNSSGLILYSDLLVENYRNTEQGNIDSVALDFVQYNSIMLLNTIGTEKNGFNNPYFNNLYKYFTKQNFNHTYGDGRVIEINWQNISDGANFVCYEIIRDTLSKLEIDLIENYMEIVNEDLGQSIQFIQNSVTGECEKVDVKEYIKK